MCWNPNGDRFGSKSLGLVEWEKGCEVAVEQAQCRRGQLVAVVGCACRSMAVGTAAVTVEPAVAVCAAVVSCMVMSCMGEGGGPDACGVRE